MTKKLVILSILMLLPSLALADDSATIGVPAARDISSTSSPPVYHTDEISAGRAVLGQYLMSFSGIQSAADFLNDPRLTLDPSVVIASSTGGGFNYFSPGFGLTSPAALRDGLAYRKKNWAYFKKAYARYGVESYYILGILRLETYFGASAGRRILPSTLYSIFVLDPTRRAFAWRELAVFLDMAKRNRVDPFAVKGSIAGAYGIPQFIPSSVYAFAADGNGDGKVNLFENADAIMSVASYLGKNGWAKNKARAIFSYNHDNGYVSAVLAYADSIKKIVER